jgi:3-methyladenine DNA glycosylase AlkD
MLPLTANTEMDARQTEIFLFCEKFFFDHENPALVNKYARYFREGYDAFGIDEKQLKQLRSNVLDKFEPDIEEIALLVPHFFATGKFEFGSIALMLLKKNRPRFTRTVYDVLKQVLDKGVENWAHADLISTKLTPVLLELEIATADDFATWRESDSRWTRRVAAVTMLYLKSTHPVQELLDFVQPLMQDKDRTVQQGIGWFLRELWKQFQHEVEDFLFQNKDTASHLIIQYATEKMNKDKKKRFRRAISDHKKPQKNQPRFEEHFEEEDLHE